MCVILTTLNRLVEKFFKYSICIAFPVIYGHILYRIVYISKTFLNLVAFLAYTIYFMVGFRDVLLAIKYFINLSYNKRITEPNICSNEVNDECSPIHFQLPLRVMNNC